MLFRSETLPSGRITTTGQEYGRKTFEKVPINMVYVECNCYSNVAMLATQVVIAESWHMPKAATGIGQIVTLKTMFPVTNVPGEIRYATTDSNGGTCAWKGCKN